jgi:cytochrome P450
MFPSDPIAAVTHSDPYPYYADLVARTPLYRDDTLGLWVAVSAEAVTAVLGSDYCRVRPLNEPAPRTLIGSPAGEIFRALVRMNDGAGHCPLKHAVSATIDSISLPEAAARSRWWAGQLVGELRPQDDRTRLAEMALRLPVYVVADLLGMVHSQLPEVVRWLSDFVRCLAPTSSAEQIERGKLASGQLRAVMQTLLEASQPGRTDILLAALAAQAHRAGCDDAGVIVANAIGFLSQAYEATAGLFGTTLITLAKQHDLHARVLDNPGLLECVLAEVLRYDPPIQNTRRFLAEDGVVAGQAMRAGDAVLVVLAAANRDETANPHPERFDPFRSERRVFTFGVGVHACPGAALATTIAQAGIAAVIASGLDVRRLADGVSYHPSANARIPLWKEAPR